MLETLLAREGSLPEEDGIGRRVCHKVAKNLTANSVMLMKMKVAYIQKYHHYQIQDTSFTNRTRTSMELSLHSEWQTKTTISTQVLHSRESAMQLRAWKSQPVSHSYQVEEVEQVLAVEVSLCV